MQRSIKILFYGDFVLLFCFFIITVEYRCDILYMDVYIAGTSVILCHGWHNYEAGDIMGKAVDII